MDEKYANILQRLEDIENRGADKTNVFTDEQTQKIREIIRDEVDIRIGRQASHLILLALGAIITAAIGAVIAYLGMRR